MGLFRRRPPSNAPRASIRAADERDLDAIVELLRRLVADRVPKRSREKYMRELRDEQRRLFSSDDAIWFVGERGSAVVACARASIGKAHPLLAYLDRPDYGYLFGIYVEDDARRAGLGRRLVDRCVAWLRARGVRHCFLHSSPEAIGFYETLGFEASLEFGKSI